MALCGALSAGTDPEAAPAPPVASSGAPAQAVVPPRSGTQLKQAIDEALARHARTSDKQADAAARELIVLYEELEQDHVLRPALHQDLRTKLRNRLAQLALQISKRQAREARLDKNRPLSVRLNKDGTVLGQQFGGAGQGGGMGGGAANNAAADSGDDLVSLIQTTIAPKSWDANGGPGTIYYWKIQHALVVRNTQEVHQDLADLIEQLNRASH
jgi:type II secretory pathway component GspD/PulD (secretin)